MKKNERLVKVKGISMIVEMSNPEYAEISKRLKLLENHIKEIEKALKRTGIIIY